MKPIINQVFVVLTVILLCSCGNSYSVYPFYQEEDVVEMDELLGMWQEMEIRDSIPYDFDAIDDTIEESEMTDSLARHLWYYVLEQDSLYEQHKDKWHWMVEKDERGGYLVSHTNYTEIYTFQVQPFILDGNIYLDVSPGMRKQYDNTYRGHFIEVHSLARVLFIDDYAMVEYLAIDEFEAGLKMLYPDIEKINKDLPDSLKVTTPTENIIIDETEKIQHAIKPYVIQDSAWSFDLVLKRK